MIRETWVLRNGELVLKGSPADAGRAHGPRSSLPCPMLIRDGIDDVRSMKDGKYYSSKSTLRRAYREQGVREIEAGELVGAAPEKPALTRNDIHAAVQKVRQGYRPQLAALPIIPTADETT